jgi:hypothetical protein
VALDGRAKLNKINVDIADQLLSHILDVAACLEKRADQPKQTTGDLRTQVAKCTVVGRGILGIFIVNCNRFGICV